MKMLRLRLCLCGKSRQDSVKKGLIEAKKVSIADNVIIHDSVRPFFFQIIF